MAHPDGKGPTTSAQVNDMWTAVDASANLNQALLSSRLKLSSLQVSQSVKPRISLKRSVGFEAIKKMDFHILRSTSTSWVASGFPTILRSEYTIINLETHLHMKEK